MKKILIAGATGFVGKALVNHLVTAGYQLNVLSREQRASKPNVAYFEWDTDKGLIDQKAFDGVSILINLSGANIAQTRWTKKRKRKLLESRTKSIDLLFHTTKALNHKLDYFISSSAVGYYGAITTEDTLTEYANKGEDFIAFICNRWENSARQFEQLGVPTLILRKGVVLGKHGGMQKKLTPLANLGLSVSLGSGRHYLPWIDIRDLVRWYEFLIKSTPIDGVFNTVASEHITSNTFSKTLLKSLGKTSYLPNAPAFLIRLALGEMASMLLEGTRVSNQKLRATGFEFHYDTLESSLNP